MVYLEARKSGDGARTEKGWRFRYLVTTPSHGSSRDHIAMELMLSGASFSLFVFYEFLWGLFYVFGLVFGL